MMKSGSMGLTVTIGVLVFFLSIPPPEFLAAAVIYAWAGLAAALLVPLLAAVYWKRATKTGGIASLSAGFLTYVLFDLFADNPVGVHTVVWALAASLVGMVVGSLVSRPPSRDVLDTFYGAPSYVREQRPTPRSASTQ